jgi:hypothetical protein
MATVIFVTAVQQSIAAPWCDQIAAVADYPDEAP